MNTLFVNCTKDTLTPEQLKASRILAPMELEYKDVYPETHKSLVNCPSDYDTLVYLVQELVEDLQYIKKRNRGPIYIHFPIGSPFFMAMFYQLFPPRKKGFSFVYSHYREKQVEKKLEDGKLLMETVYEFEKFLILSRPD